MKDKRIYIICSAVILAAVYMGMSFYFKDHFYIGTVINGVNISFKSVDDADAKLSDFTKNYILVLEERNDKKEEIKGEEIDLKYNSREKLILLKEKQKPFKWIWKVFNPEIRTAEIDGVTYDDKKFKYKFNFLGCFTSNIEEPKNPEFKYTEEGYEICDEIYGNKVDKDVLLNCVVDAILRGRTSLNLEELNCYENPKYRSNDSKVLEAKELLDKYVSSKIYYTFDEQMELVDGSLINSWIYVTEDMEVKFDESKVNSYMKELVSKYNTFGKPREFKTSVGKTLQVDGGFYGWRINGGEEVKALINNIKNGQTIVKEPIYIQRAAVREDNDIGNTYVEINITRQHLWFYKEGKLVVQGDVVTGNVNRGTPTPLGTYFINYKEKNATLKGAGYSSDVTFWMPFNGNVGIHDASWRGSFGGNIYKSDGSHGCVNAPKYLAKTIFDNIDAGTPVVCYSEEKSKSK